MPQAKKRPARRTAPKAAMAAAYEEPQVLFPDWEVKDRIYVLATKATPVSFQLRSRHTKFRELTWFDTDQKIPRSLRYVTNQTTFFEDEQVEPALLGEIVFEDGTLKVPASNTVLQQFLAVHPDNQANGGGMFYEFNPEKAAQESIDKELQEYEAINIILNMEVEDLEALGRIYFHSAVDTKGTAVLKRDLIVAAKADPQKFITLANDPNTKLRNVAQRALDLGILRLGNDNVTVTWGDTGVELMRVPFGENTIYALAKFFRTDEGMDAVQTIGTKLS